MKYSFFFEICLVPGQLWRIVDSGVLVQHRVSAYSIHLVYIFRRL